jgi:hypothetical protein
MSKKKVQKRPPIPPKVSVPSVPDKRLDSTPPDTPGETDYGGLPKRDLKKNLGCG